jgi:glycosyltransferase involved in cell wall biosynthesis
VTTFSETPHLRIVHIISGLGAGGAENMLCKLLSQTTRACFAPEVISLTDRGQLGDKIEALDIPVNALNMRRGVPNPVGLIKLAKLLRERKPALIQTWMYHADVLGGLVAKAVTDVPIVWNIRASQLSWAVDKKTFLVLKASALLSNKIPTKIISCSEDAYNLHAKLGYDAAKVIVIPNGFDLASYKIDSAARASIGEELGIPPEVPIVGLVTRFHPQKDIHNFVQAAALLRREIPNPHFVMSGTGISWDTPELAQWVAAVNLRDCFHLLGRRVDIPRLTAAFDVASSSSAFGEGFPNVLGEAMACGVPCVATDVGDSALIIGDTGIVVPPKNPQALADGWKKILMMEVEERRNLGRAARRRIEENFSLDSVVARYENLYRELLTSP